MVGFWKRGGKDVWIFGGKEKKKGGKKWVTIDESKGVGIQGKVS